MNKICLKVAVLTCACALTASDNASKAVKAYMTQVHKNELARILSEQKELDPKDPTPCFGYPNKAAYLSMRAKAVGKLLAKLHEKQK